MQPTNPAGGVMIAPPGQQEAMRRVAIAGLADRLYGEWWARWWRDAGQDDAFPTREGCQLAARAAIEAAAVYVDELLALKEGKSHA